MPYIDQAARAALHGWPVATRESDLAYIITKAVTEYLAVRGHGFAAYTEVLGVLEAVKLELYRRVVAPYEDQKREENGDVF